jgi:hypothetical protein
MHSLSIVKFPLLISGQREGRGCGGQLGEFCPGTRLSESPL